MSRGLQPPRRHVPLSQQALRPPRPLAAGASPSNLPNDDLGAFVKQLKEMNHQELYELLQQQRRVLDAHPEWFNRRLSSEPAPPGEPVPPSA